MFQRNTLNVNYHRSLPQEKEHGQELLRGKSCLTLQQKPWSSMTVLELCISFLEVEGSLKCRRWMWLPMLLRRGRFSWHGSWYMKTASPWKGIDISLDSSRKGLCNYGHVFPSLWALIISTRTLSRINCCKRWVWEQIYTLLVNFSFQVSWSWCSVTKERSGEDSLFCVAALLCPLCQGFQISLFPSLSVFLSFFLLLFSLPPYLHTPSLLSSHSSVPPCSEESSNTRRHFFSQTPLQSGHQPNLSSQMSCGLWLWFWLNY